MLLMQHPNSQNLIGLYSLAVQLELNQITNSKVIWQKINPCKIKKPNEIGSNRQGFFDKFCCNEAHKNITYQSHDVASGNVIPPCIRIAKPLVYYLLW